MDEPAASQVNAGVIDLAGLRLRTVNAEEEDVPRGQLLQRDPKLFRHLAAHLHGRAALDDVREVRGAGIRVELVDVPDEARAVEAARSADSERSLWPLARAAPDVREADQRDGCVQDLRLHRRERG